MSDIGKNNNIGKFDKNDPRYLKTSEAEIARSKNKTEDSYFLHHEKPIKKSLLLFTKVMQNLKRKFESPEKKNLSHLAADEAEFYIILEEFLQKLSTLRSTDVSKDIPFINSLSQIFEKLSYIVERRKRLKTPPAYLSLLTATMKDIDNFGEKEGKSFGFYLKEHANTDWFPVPYLKMLRYLYINAQELQEQSILSSWQKGLKEILTILLKND